MIALFISISFASAIIFTNGQSIFVCPDAPEVENGKVSPGPSYIGAFRRAVCNPGYYSPNRVVMLDCSSNGTWTATSSCVKAINDPDFVSAATGRDGIQRIKQLLSSGVDIESRDYENSTALIVAADRGLIEVVKFLLDYGADVNAYNNAGNYPLLRAAWKGHPEIARILLDHGADLNVINGALNSALNEIMFGYADMATMQVLLNYGANVNFTNGDNKTALMLATEMSHTGLMEPLLQHGIDVNIKDKYGYTVLLKAAEKLNFESMRLFLRYGADINAANNNGDTALIISSRDYYGGLFGVQLLIDNGADVNIKNNQGKTALDVATNVAIASLLRTHLTTNTQIAASSLEISSQDPARSVTDS